MGLDTVELVMEFEDVFETAIPDAAAAKMNTIGDTAEYITRALVESKPPAGICATARSFYALRREFVARFNAARDDVRPEATVGSLAGSASARQWSQIMDAAGLRRIRTLLFKKTYPPAQITIRELIQSRCKTRWLRFDGSVDQGAIMQQIRQLASEQSGVPLERIDSGTRYIHDLF